MNKTLMDKIEEETSAHLGKVLDRAGLSIEELVAHGQKLLFSSNGNIHAVAIGIFLLILTETELDHAMAISYTRKLLNRTIIESGGETLIDELDIFMDTADSCWVVDIKFRQTMDFSQAFAENVINIMKMKGREYGNDC